ncbi:MAG: dCTP deaminase [Candidatus Altiarchaeales archaeon ex4484_2]|nr:MAG: dCTP deaminase [Candidatus Altiarchaeales archaeon ex4484_2]
MLLGREKILELVERIGLIEGFDRECLEGCGYDLRLERIHEIKGGAYLGVDYRDLPKIREERFEEYALNPGEYILVETLEKINMPSDLAARILPRSTLFRSGAALQTALVDPGYQGTLTMGLINHGRAEFRIQKNSRIAQIIFEKIEGKTKKYNGRYQGGRVV